MAGPITNFNAAALDQQAAIIDFRIAESTRRQTELMAARAGASFGAFGPLLNIPGQSFDPGAFLNLQPLGFGGVAPAAAQQFSQGMLGIFNQLSSNWSGLLGAPPFGAPSPFFGSALGGVAPFGAPQPFPMGGGGKPGGCH